MRDEDDRVDFAIRNLMCMQGITLSREDIFHIARYAIENNIINLTGTLVGNICFDIVDLQENIDISEIFIIEKESK